MSAEHLPFEQLADYVDGRLPADVVARVDAHLTVCAACRREVDWLRAALSRDEWVAPPQRASAAVRRAFREQARPAPMLLDPIRALFRRPLGWALGFAALALLVASVFLFQTWRTTEVAQVARLSDVNGVVEVLPAGEATWRVGANDNELRSGDRLRTQSGASATLTYFEGSEVRLEGDTEFSLVRLSSRPDGQTPTIIAGQTRGFTIHTVRPLPADTARYEVDAPGAMITVRGTVFSVSVGDRGALDVSVSEGAVAISGVDGPALVSAGESFRIEPAATATATPTASPSATATTASPTATATLAPSATAVPAAGPTATSISAEPATSVAPPQDDDDDDGDDMGDDADDDDGDD